MYIEVGALQSTNKMKVWWNCATEFWRGLARMVAHFEAVNSLGVPSEES
jgi:hypothetical protein